MSFQVALKTIEGRRVIFYSEMELADAMAIAQSDIDNGEPSVINVERSEELTTAIRSERERDAEASAVVLNPKNETRIVDVDADSIEDAIDIVRGDYSGTQLEIDRSRTEELNQESEADDAS